MPVSCNSQYLLCLAPHAECKFKLKHVSCQCAELSCTTYKINQQSVFEANVNSIYFVQEERYSCSGCYFVTANLWKSNMASGVAEGNIQRGLLLIRIGFSFVSGDIQFIFGLYIDNYKHFQVTHFK